jgi:hypothetical protein
MKTNLIVAIVAVAGAVSLTAAFMLGDAPNMAVALGLAIVAAIVERAGLSIAPGARASASSVVILAAAALEGPAAAGVVAIGAAVAATAFRNRPAVKIVFNLGQLTIAATTAGYVLTLIGTDASLLVVASGALAAGTVNHLTSSGLVSCVVASHAGTATALDAARQLARVAPIYAAVAVPYVTVAAMVANGVLAFGVLAVLVGCGTVAIRRLVRAMSIDAEFVAARHQSGPHAA